MLTSSDGVFTGGLYGFLVTLAKQIRETQATHVVICHDRKPYRRSLVYPDYKQLRKKSRDPELHELHECSMKLIRAACDEIGLPHMAYTGFESDDCIGTLAKKYRSRFDRIYASSNDSDLYQLLNYDNFWILKTDLAEAVDAKVLKAKHGLTPDEFMLATALMGTHNDIEGIPRVGEGTAFKAVKDPALLRSLRERYSSIIDRNLALIKLPHEDFPRVESLPAAGHFNHRRFYRFCAPFDIEVTKSMLDSFERVCP